jgi:hypothetical protein
MSRSRRTPSFAIVWECFIVSPQEGHNIVSVLSGARGKRSTTGTGGVLCGMPTPLKQAGALPDSQPPTPDTGPLSAITCM